MNVGNMKRLALIRYMYNLAVKQSYEPEPLTGLSILTFQDSIEMFLQLSCEHLNIGVNPKKEPAFMEYFTLIKTVKPEFTQQDSIHRLNKARVAFKHHGNMPSKLDIESFRASTTNFFAENTLSIFDIEFSNISLIELVTSLQIQEKLFEATRLLSLGKNLEASKCIAIAFKELIYDYHRKNVDEFGNSIFQINDSSHISRFKSYGSDAYSSHTEMKEVETAVNSIQNQLGRINDILEIIILGIDYKKYIKFASLMPEATKCIGGSYYIQELKEVPTEEAIKYGIDFIIECALALDKS